MILRSAEQVGPPPLRYYQWPCGEFGGLHDSRHGKHITVKCSPCVPVIVHRLRLTDNHLSDCLNRFLSVHRDPPIYLERAAFKPSRIGLRSFGEKIFVADKYFVLGTRRLAAFSRWSKFSPAMQSASANPLNRAANSISTKALRPSKKHAKPTGRSPRAKTLTA